MKYWEVKPSSCELTPTLREKSYCSTREEFDAFVALYLEEAPKKINGVKLSDNRDRNRINREIQSGYQNRPFFIDLAPPAAARNLFSPAKLRVRRRKRMSNETGSPIRYDQAFWRAHHEAWQQGALKQR
jgi:hypothetical protein